MKKLVSFFLICSLFLSSHSFAKSKVQTLETENGTFDIIINAPKSKKKPAPLLFIAPAKKYDMSKKIFEDIAVKAAALGYFVVRFDWGFYTNKAEASSNLVREAKEFNLIHKNILKKYAKRIETKNQVLLAKSFGSRVILKSDLKDFTAFLLVTPNCDRRNLFKMRYNNFLKSKKNLGILISTHDPYCSIEQIYQGVYRQKSNLSLMTVGGDHNFTSQTDHSEFNQNLAIQNAVNWLNWQIKR